MTGRLHTVEPWPDHGDQAETLVTGPTARAVLGPAVGGPFPWPRDPLWYEASRGRPASDDDDQETLW